MESRAAHALAGSKKKDRGSESLRDLTLAWLPPAVHPKPCRELPALAFQRLLPAGWAGRLLTATHPDAVVSFFVHGVTGPIARKRMVPYHFGWESSAGLQVDPSPPRGLVHEKSGNLPSCRWGRKRSHDHQPFQLTTDARYFLQIITALSFLVLIQSHLGDTLRR
jgi:hypothetical protein